MLQKNIAMKIVAPILALVVLAVVFASCEKRDWSCYCKLPSGIDKEFNYGRMSKDRAEKKCNDQQKEYYNNPSTATTSCNLIY